MRDAMRDVSVLMRCERCGVEHEGARDAPDLSVSERCESECVSC